MAPWAVQAASGVARSNYKSLMNVYYEEMLHIPIYEIRESLNILPFVSKNEIKPQP